MFEYILYLYEWVIIWIFVDLVDLKQQTKSQTSAAKSGPMFLEHIHPISNDPEILFLNYDFQ